MKQIDSVSVAAAIIPQILGDPFAQLAGMETWPAQWICRNDDAGPPQVTLYRLRFTLAQPRPVRLHVSGDEWFEFFCDDALVIRGPQIGCPTRWFFQTVDLELAAGQHTLQARVYAVGKTLRPQPVMSVEPGWLCCPDPDDPLMQTLATGQGAWEWQDASAGWSFGEPGITNQYATAFGPATQHFPTSTGWLPSGREDGWSSELRKRRAHIGACSGAEGRLFPGQASATTGEPVRGGRVRHVSRADCLELYREKSSTKTELREQAVRMLGGEELTISAGERLRILIDWDDYVLGFARLTVDASPGAELSITWTERLMPTLENGKCWDAPWSRARVEGLYVIGPRDRWRFEASGSWQIHQPWKRCGRYLEIVARAGEQSMTLRGFVLEDGLPPSPLVAEFSSDYPLLNDLLPICRRTLEVGLESTFCDTPYYEQVQWVGDLYPILLCHLAAGGDEAVYRQALQLVAESVQGTLLTQARYPHSRSSCVILSFGLWYILAVHDYALWRGHREFVRSLMPTVRRNLEAFLACQSESGLIITPSGWNYFDWAPGWERGMPPMNAQRESGPLNLLLAVTCDRLGDLENWLGEDELASRWKRYSRSVFRACQEHLWSDDRGVYRDSPGLESCSEHSQVLALLHPDVPEHARDRVLKMLAQPDAQVLTPMQPFFTHHLFEALARHHRIDLLFDRLEDWRFVVENDFRTTPETLPGTRSDSHGWSSHPLFHAIASVAGVRPGSFGFGTVVIRPQPGPVIEYRTRMWTPKGFLSLEIHNSRGAVHLTGELPEGLEGRVETQGNPSQPISGKFSVHLPAGCSLA